MCGEFKWIIQNKQSLVIPRNGATLIYYLEIEKPQISR